MALKSKIEIKSPQPKSTSSSSKRKGNGLMARDSGINFAIQKKTNTTGLPDNLKAGIEHLSGYSMDDVKVHYNSSKPSQLNAHAYAQGNQIHIASGQENIYLMKPGM